jgi:hypothetical protein
MAVCYFVCCVDSGAGVRLKLGCWRSFVLEDINYSAC